MEKSTVWAHNKLDTMRTISVTLNGVSGLVTISITDDDAGVQTLTLQWGQLPTNDFGFQTDFHPGFIRLTEPAAAIFLGSMVTILRSVLDVKDTDCTIINDRGEQLPEIQFLPPTFSGGSDDIEEFARSQEVLASAHHVFEASGRRLTEEFLTVCAEQEVLEDFLSLVESKLTGIHFNLDCLADNTEEN